MKTLMVTNLDAERATTIIRRENVIVWYGGGDWERRGHGRECSRLTQGAIALFYALAKIGINLGRTIIWHRSVQKWGSTLTTVRTRPYLELLGSNSGGGWCDTTRVGPPLLVWTPVTLRVLVVPLIRHIRRRPLEVISHPLKRSHHNSTIKKGSRSLLKVVESDLGEEKGIIRNLLWNQKRMLALIANISQNKTWFHFFFSPSPKQSLNHLLTPYLSLIPHADLFDVSACHLTCRTHRHTVPL